MGRQRIPTPTNEEMCFVFSVSIKNVVKLRIIMDNQQSTINRSHNITLFCYSHFDDDLEPNKSINFLNVDTRQL